jgi:hypothetical protein
VRLAEVPIPERMADAVSRHSICIAAGSWQPFFASRLRIVFFLAWLAFEYWHRAESIPSSCCLRGRDSVTRNELSPQARGEGKIFSVHARLPLPELQTQGRIQQTFWYVTCSSFSGLR